MLLYRAHELFEWIRCGKGDGSYKRRLAHIAKIPLLVLDDFGLQSLSLEQQEDLYEVIAQRYEIIVQGTNDDPKDPAAQWSEYEFKGKPGDVSRRPAVIAPYHLRLDWQMWFAAMSNYKNNPWFVHFVTKLLRGDQAVLRRIERHLLRVFASLRLKKS